MYYVFIEGLELSKKGRCIMKLQRFMRLPLVVLLGLIFSVLIPMSASAYQVGDEFKVPVIEIPFAEMTASLKTAYDYDPGTTLSGSQSLKFKAAATLDKAVDIHPDAGGILIGFALHSSVFEATVPDWFLPIPAGAFERTQNGYRLSGTPEKLGIQLLQVENGVVTADLSDAIDYIRGTVGVENPTFVDNPTFIVKLTATGYFEGSEPGWWLPLGAASGVRLFFINAFVIGGGAAIREQTADFIDGISQ
jgi:hypothetical protein